MTKASDIPVHCSHSELADVVSLTPNPRNPNKHPDKQIAMLAKIIRHQGWRSPIVVSNRSGFVVKGHGRLEAAKLLQVEKVPVDRQDYLTEADEWADLIADNRIAELAETDDQEIATMLKELDGKIDLDLVGFDSEALTELEEFAEKSAVNAEPQIDRAEELRSRWGAETGQLWELGDHRLLCGDCTNVSDIEKLMASEKADVWITDPPYNVAYIGKTADAMTIENDSMDDASFRAFLIAAYKAADAVMKQGAVFYIWHADLEGFNFRGAAKDIGWKVRQCLVWNKSVLVMGRQDYHWKHEPCLYGWKEGAGHYWGSDRKQTTVLDFDKPSRNGEHPTMKPVDLFAYQIKNSSCAGGVVLDSFSGSGTTIIACEQLGRKCRAVEISPAYVAVALQRWADATGKTPVLISKS